jgi:DNA-directed RNA polymerase subunit RPC12/RpoP
MNPVKYSGRCSRCAEPAAITRPMAHRAHEFTVCGRCSLHVVLMPEDAGEQKPVTCADCSDILKYDLQREKYVCPRCDAKG